MVSQALRTRGIAPGLAFDEEDCRRLIVEAWSRYTGQPVGAQGSATSSRSPGFFGLTQRRRWHLFKLPSADPVLPVEMGEYPHYQSDFLRQKHWELVGRLLENRFRIRCTAADDSETARKTADRAEWVLTYGALSIQERTGVDWQAVLAGGASAYGVGILHYRIVPELTALTPDAKYVADEPTDPDEKKHYALTSESVDGDVSKGKYRETAASVQDRAALAKARAPFPIHVEAAAADQVVFIEDESHRPGPGMTVHIKEVGIIDYNGKLAKDGLRLIASPTDAQGIKLSMEEFEPKTGIAMERPSPIGGQLPSVAGWKQRIAIAHIWTRDECYELASPMLLAGDQGNPVGTSSWLLVKAGAHGYGRVPYVRAFASIEYNEWDPALRYQPALAGLYATKPQYDFSRAIEMKVAVQHAIERYFFTQDKDAPPALEGDEEGAQIVLSRDSAQAQMLPPGVDLKATPVNDMNPAFVRSRELEAEEMKAAAPPTGHTEISATTQPWNIRLGQSMTNAYPQQLLLSIAKALAEMMRNIVEVAAKPVDEGGLGVGLYVPAQRMDKQGKPIAGKVNMAQAVGMEPADWEGIWTDIEIDATSSAERVTQTQMGLQLLNNPIHISTPEQFVSEDMGVQDATGHMQEVDAYWAIQPFIEGQTRQALAKLLGLKVMVGADGVAVGSQGQAMQPQDVLAQNGVRPQQPPSPAPVPQMGGSAQMPGLPPMVGNGAAPIAGIPMIGGGQ